MVTNDDIMKLKVGEVVCINCNKLFNMEHDSENYWIKSDDKIPYVRCKRCYPHPDQIISNDAAYIPDISHQLSLFR